MSVEASRRRARSVLMIGGSNRVRPTVCLIACLAAACGGGGGGSGGGGGGGNGNSLPPSSGPGDVENFFPNAVGNSWSYLTISTNAGSAQPLPFLDSVAVTGSKSVNGSSASVFLDSNPSDSGTPSGADRK